MLLVLHYQYLDCDRYAIYIGSSLTILALDTQWLTFDFQSKRLDTSFLVHRNMLLVQGRSSFLSFSHISQQWYHPRWFLYYHFFRQTHCNWSSNWCNDTLFQVGSSFGRWPTLFKGKFSCLYPILTNLVLGSLRNSLKESHFWGGDKTSFLRWETHRRHLTHRFPYKWQILWPGLRF